jgi:hypothetical protein
MEHKVQRTGTKFNQPSAHPSIPHLAPLKLCEGDEWEGLHTSNQQQTSHF